MARLESEVGKAGPLDRNFRDNFNLNDHDHDLQQFWRSPELQRDESVSPDFAEFIYNVEHLLVQRNYQICSVSDPRQMSRRVKFLLSLIET